MVLLNDKNKLKAEEQKIQKFIQIKRNENEKKIIS